MPRHAVPAAAPASDIAEGAVPQAFRALLFSSDQRSRELDAAALVQMQKVDDSQLLWVDVVVPEGAADGVQWIGADPALLDPDAGGVLGLMLTPEWKYLYVRALNWQGGRRPEDVPIAVGVGPNMVVTVHRRQADFIAAVLDNEADHLRVGRLESTSFATALLDRMLTDYLDARDAFETALDRVELLILRKPRPTHLGELQSLRHVASRLRRQLAVQRDLFDALGRPDFDPGQSDSAGQHARALSKRYASVMASIEAARELVNGSFDLYTSRAAESTNHAMHTLTVVTVVMGLSATVAGVLGMNFDSKVFATGEEGFVIAATVISLLVVGAIGWAIRRMFNGTFPKRDTTRHS